MLPHSLRLYFACPALACWLKAHAETDAFLDDESLSNPPPVVRWSEQAYLAVGHFARSDTVVAVQVDCADPIVAWGYLGDTQSFPLHPLPFPGWLDGIAGDILGPFRKPT